MPKTVPTPLPLKTAMFQLSAKAFKAQVVDGLKDRNNRQLHMEVLGIGERWHGQIP